MGAEFKKVISNTFTKSDTLIRPANTTTYAAQKSINCSLTVSAGSYAGKVVTLTSNGHGLVAGDRITVAGINTGFTWANVDGNWIVDSSDTNTFTFTVTSQPTGTTPATASVTGAVAKLMRFEVGRSNGSVVSIRRITVNMPGLGLGALRLYLYNAQSTVLTDQATFTILSANDSFRRAYVDLYPITEGSGSDTSVAVWTGEIIMACESTTKYIYGRLVKEVSDNAVVAVSAATIRTMITGYQM